MEAEEIRLRLIKALQSNKVDYGEILSLSTELARHDKDYVRFSVDAGLIIRLGEELVARQETAVSEIVKNAYDADATEVTLIFASTEQAGGRLIIKDNGNGMTREQLVSGFMRLASPDKTLEPVSPIYHRTRAGKKGIGRFAVQRLGKEMMLITQTRNGKRSLKLEINWRKFQSHEDLGNIAHQISYTDAREHGTTIVINNLREAWNSQSIARAYRFTEELLQPAPFGAPSNTLNVTQKPSADPGFKVTFLQSDGIQHQEVAGEQTMVLDYAAGLVDAYVDANGQGFWNLTSNKLNISEKNNKVKSINNEERAYKYLRDIRLQAYYFVYEKELVPSKLLPSLQNLGRARGGIRLYRNGFRVLPYGERGDDWLNLDEDQARRVVLPALGNINWFGFIEVKDLQGALFEETSSREGLLNTDAFQELRSFASDTLKLVVLRIAAARGRKLLASQKGFISRKKQESLAEAMRQAAAALRGAAEKESGNGGSSDDPSSGGQNNLLTQADNLEQAAAESEKLLQELTFLRILSSLGLSIGEFSHEIRTIISSMTSGLVILAESPELTHETTDTLSDVNVEFTKLASYVSYYDKTISASVSRQLSSQNLSKIVFDFWETFGPIADKNGVLFHEPFIEEQILFTKPMHHSEWASILVNLFSNSIKAIRRARKVGRGEIQVRTFRIGELVAIDFSDNGDGISEENEERIFEAFFTTSESHANSDTLHDDFIGTGLGLKIVLDIIQSSGGTISLSKPPPLGYQTCFRVSVPAEKELS